MSDANREVAYSSFYTGASIALCIIGLGWLLAALRGFFNVSFWTDEHGRPEPVSMYIIVASLLTVPSLLWILVGWRRAAILATRGVLTDGRIIAISALRKHGESPVTVQYQAGGVDYQKRKDMSRNLSVGTAVRVLYDPQNPARAMILDVSYRLQDRGPSNSEIL